eukprot:scaffold17060_cov59-Phaeocystis_antarctica.AAC.2
MPPTGALNAAAMPAAAPMPTQSRCALGERNSVCSRMNGRVTRERPEPMIDPMCTMGPSLPSGMAVLTTSVMPICAAWARVGLGAKAKGCEVGSLG